MKLQELIERLKQMKETKGNLEVLVQEYGRKDAPRAFTPIQYACRLKVKPHDDNSGLYQVELNPDSREAEEVCLIAYV